MNTSDVFKSISDRLLSDFKSITKSVKHSPSKGRVLENRIIEEYSKIYLPKRVGISNGEIVCVDGTVSSECDCVIFDATTCPFLVDKENFRVFPVESVLGVIEIKAKLGQRELSTSIENLAKIKGFPKTAYLDYFPLPITLRLYDTEWDYFPTFGAIIAYDSKDLGELARSMNELSRDKPPHQRVDLTCVLNRGCIVNRRSADGRIDVCPSERTEYQAVESENPLMLATIFLQETFQVAWTQPFMLREYLEGSFGRFIDPVALNRGQRKRRESAKSRRSSTI